MTDSLLADIASYLPRLVLERHTSGNAQLGQPAEERFPAALVFVDVSGFTKLAERLAQLGPEGAEQLTRILNAHFGPLIDRIHEWGGDVAKFAGDALLVLWPAHDGNLAQAAVAGVECALALQTLMDDLAARQAAGGPDALSIKVVVGAGDMRLAHLGGTRDRWEVMVTGLPLVEIGHVSHLALPGKVLVTPELAALLGERLEVSAEGFVSAVRGSEAASGGTRDKPPEAGRHLAEVAQMLAGYVPEAVTTRLAAGQSSWLSELRRVTVMFVNFPNATHETTLERAQSVMLLLQSVLDRFEGTLNKLSVDEKGVSMVAAFGLPPLSHEDDAARAIQSAFALQTVLRGLDVVHAIGIATGRAFCGVVGNDHRREYTVMGDTVNLAARLMQKARQDILCDQATATLAGSRFGFEALPPLSLKGKAEPVPVLRPGPLAANSAPAAPAHTPADEMVGRHAELNLLAERLGILSDGGNPGVVIIEGEAGIGKSRLVQALTALAAEREICLVLGAGDAVERTTPYHAWRGPLFELLGLDSAGDDPAARRDHLLARLAGDADALALAPLLGAILAVEIPDNDTTSQMTGGVRADNTRDLLMHLIRRCTTEERVAVVVEDAHWLDSASWALLVEMHRQLPEILLVLALRPLSEPVPLEYRRLAGEAGSARIVLEALSADETLALVCRRLGAASLPDEVSRLIRDRAAGHPFFSEELAYALRDSGQIVIRGGECRLAPGAALGQLDLPSTVQAAITSRVDRLPPSLQLTMKVASVIGRVFALKTLRDVYPIEADRPALQDNLVSLHQLDLTPLESPEPDLAYVFKHVITQQVVYDLMLFAQRQEMHRSVAEWYEREHQADLAAHYPLLAHHWGKAGDAASTLGYLDKAGELALASGAYREAVEFLTEADSLDEKAPIATAESAALRKARRQRILGDAFISLGRLAESRECLGRATALLGFPVPHRRHQWLRWGAAHVVWQLMNHFLPGWYVGRNLRRPREELLEASRAFERLGPVFFWLNQPLQTMFSALAGLNLSEWAGPSPELAKSYANLAVGTSLIPLHRVAAGYAQCAMDAAAKQHNLAASGWVHEILGLYLAGVGPWDRASEALNRGAAISERLGDRRRQEECLTISALIDFGRGELDKALGIYAHVAQSARERGDLHMAGGSLTSVGFVQMRLGSPVEARAAIEEGLGLLEGTRAVTEQVGGYALLGLALLQGGDSQGARHHANLALDQMEKVRPTAVYTLEGYSAVAEVFITLWERDPARADAQLKGQVRRALAQQRLFARIFPIARARLLYWQGVVAWLEGANDRATVFWRDAKAQAERHGLPYDLKLVQARFGGI